MNFPIVAVEADVVTAYETPQLFSSCFRTFIGRFQRGEVIDSLGKSWRISNVRIVESLGPWWVRLFGGSSELVRVEFDELEIGSVSVDQLREIVSKRLRMSSGWAIVRVGFVAEYGCEEAKVIMDKVDGAVDARDIIGILLSAPENIATE